MKGKNLWIFGLITFGLGIVYLALMDLFRIPPNNIFTPTLMAILIVGIYNLK